jgi:phage repressor protein C with HTH and peptisase S24 domain
LLKQKQSQHLLKQKQSQHLLKQNHASKQAGKQKQEIKRLFLLKQKQLKLCFSSCLSQNSKLMQKQHTKLKQKQQRSFTYP